MRQDYVVFKGKRYNSGDKIDILWHTHGCKNARYYTGIFLDCDEEKDEYRFIVDDMTYCFNKICFYRTMCDNPPPNGVRRINNIPKELTLEKELNIDGLFLAWIWYIFIMVVGTIFRGNIMIWITASIIFFNYRNKKLREAGYR